MKKLETLIPNVLHLTLYEIKEELNYFNVDTTLYTDEEIYNKFQEHCLTYSEDVEIKKLIDSKSEKELLVSTPDGFQRINDFVVKTPRTCYKITTKMGYSIKCSEDHLIETTSGWVYAKDINDTHKILTKLGFDDLQEKDLLPTSEVYDFEVNHINHRYWGGSGISSHNTGKTFVCLNICREAQQKGYNIIYIDTEATIDKHIVESFGCDLSTFRIENISIVENLKIYLAKFIDKMKELKKSGKELPKIMLVIDSMGQLGSRKELEDAKEGKMVADMSRSKALKSLFRVINSDLGNLNIPMILTNHTYMSQGLYPVEVFSGGGGAIFTATTILMLSKAKYQTGKEDEFDMNQSGIKVNMKAVKNRLAKPKKMSFIIDFTKGANKFTGLENFCTPDNFQKIGIAKGKPEIDTDTGELTLKPGGTRWYIRHLDKSVFENQLFNSTVFNKDVLDAIDEVAKKYFKYASSAEMIATEEDLNAELEKITDNANEEENVINDLFD